MPISNSSCSTLATLVLTLVLHLSSGGRLSAQHDPGRDAMRMIAKGELDAARQRVAKPPRSQNSPISDAERNYVLAIIDCKANDPASAIQHLRTAVSLDLPIERILAGPRELFTPLRKDASFDAWIRENSKPLLHGPMLTSLTDTSAEFWVRTADVATVSVVLTDAATAKPISATTRPTSDFTGIVVVEGLDPATEYEAQVSVDGQLQPETSVFKTFPAKGQPARITIGFGGGSGYTPQYNHMWSTIQDQSLTAFLTLGDNVYIDDPEHAMTQRYCYYRRQSEPLWKSFVSATPVFSIYDDHDFGVNDCIPGPAIDKPAWKRPVWEVFRQNWNNPGFGGGEAQPGCWYDFRIGDVQFIMLDGRYYRDLKGGSMLGPVQKKWLLETLSQS
ncbi:MAG: alkaline phosphatase D family protein, partial [Rubripirellula sp.]